MLHQYRYSIYAFLSKSSKEIKDANSPKKETRDDKLNRSRQQETTNLNKTWNAYDKDFLAKINQDDSYLFHTKGNLFTNSYLIM